MDDEAIRDLVNDAGLDWHTGFTLDEDEPNRYVTLVRAALAAQGAARIDPMQDPMRPTLAKLGPSDEHPAEEVLRKLACWLGVGGYNAPTVDADLFHRKIVAGIEDLRKNAAQPAPGWIACSERMPPNDAEPVLAIIAPRRRYYLLAGDVMNRSYATSRITHWMPLPEPPETLLDVAHRLIEAEAERISARAKLERDKGSEQ